MPLVVDLVQHIVPVVGAACRIRVVDRVAMDRAMKGTGVRARHGDKNP